jgi:hypothetical protein
MLQKLPKNDGDSIMLGTLVAVGICPVKKNFSVFASFEFNGELVSYELPNDELAEAFTNILASRVLRDSGEVDTDQDLRYAIDKTTWKITDKQSNTVASSGDY